MLSVLLYFRNREAALFPRAISIVLFSCNSARFLYRFLNRVSFSTSYSSLSDRLHKLGDSVLKTLEDLGKCVQNGETSVVWIYNNIQQNYVAWNLDNIRKATLLSIWTKYVNSLRNFSPETRDLFTTKHKKHPLRLRKSTYYSLKTSNIDESRPVGAKAVLADITSQLKMEEADLDDVLIPVAGDLVTVDRVRKLKRYTCTDTGIYNQHKWALPWIQLWHMKWAALRSLYNIHWTGNITKHTYGLRNDCSTLQRKNLNPVKCDFHSHNEAATVTFESLCIGALR